MRFMRIEIAIPEKIISLIRYTGRFDDTALCIQNGDKKLVPIRKKTSLFVKRKIKYLGGILPPRVNPQQDLIHLLSQKSQLRGIGIGQRDRLMHRIRSHSIFFLPQR